MCLLYSKEKSITKKARNIINDYDNSEREKNKKLFELFHLLVFLDVANLKFDKIIPNEPGDFIIEHKNEKYMIEIVLILGNDNENIKMKNILKKLFAFKNEFEISNQIIFNNQKMKKLFLKKLEEKDGKDYGSNQNISKKYLLIVTGEYDNCSVTGGWFLKFLQKEELYLEKNFDKVMILDYFASGKNNDPMAIKDFYNEFHEYKNISNRN